MTIVFLDTKGDLFIDFIQTEKTVDDNIVTFWKKLKREMWVVVQQDCIMATNLTLELLRCYNSHSTIF